MITQDQMFNEALDQSTITFETPYQSTDIPNLNPCTTIQTAEVILPNDFERRTDYQLHHLAKSPPPHLWNPSNLALETGIIDRPVLQSTRSPSTLCASPNDESGMCVDERAIDPPKFSRHETERQQLPKSTKLTSTRIPSEYVFEWNNTEGQSRTGSNRRRKRMRQETSSPTTSMLSSSLPKRKRAKNGTVCVRCKLFKEKVRYI